MAAVTGAEEATDDLEPPRWRREVPVDVAVVVGLAVLGLVVRLRTFPRDGLWHDDTWVAAGAKAPLSDLWAVSTNHPGFTLLLMAWRQVVSTSTEGLVLPVVAAGVAGGPLLYLVLRRLRHHPATSALVSVLLVLCATHVQYSTRLKPYTIELGVVLLGVAAVPALARRRWTWRTALAWVALAVAAGSISAFALLASAVAVVVLALHPHGDRPLRAAALVAQGAIQAAVGLKMRASYDTEAVNEDWERIWDSYIELSTDVPDLVRQVGLHVARVGQAYVGGGRLVGLLVVAAAVAGLAWSSIAGRHRLASRYLLGLLAVAFVGGVAGQVPFGPNVDRQIFPGSRASLWLIPSLAVGLAAAAEGVAAALRRARPELRFVVPALAVVATLAVSVTRAGDEPLHADTGTRSATEHVERHRDDSTAVVVFPSQLFAVASAAPVPVEVDPGGYFGFEPVLPTRVVLPRAPLDADAVEELVGGADRVVVHSTFSGFGDGGREELETALVELGHRLVSDEEIALNRVWIWERAPG